VITGKTRADSGRVYFAGAIDLGRLREHEIARVGVGRKFQRPTVFEQHTAFENLELARGGERGVWRTLFRSTSPAERERIEEVLLRTGLSEQRDQRAGRLSHGQKQWLEIAMLLVQDPKVLLVDEPVAGMSPAETQRTAELLASLAGPHTVVVVEHDMEFVRKIAHRVTVLHEGRVLSEGDMDRVQSDPRVVEVYLGKPECSA
jgi:urea transport system ATP-binding protein